MEWVENQFLVLIRCISRALLVLKKQGKGRPASDQRRLKNRLSRVLTRRFEDRGTDESWRLFVTGRSTIGGLGTGHFRSNQRQRMLGRAYCTRCRWHRKGSPCIIQTFCRESSTLLCRESFILLCRASSTLLCRESSTFLLSRSSTLLCRELSTTLCRESSTLLCRETSTLLCRVSCSTLLCRETSTLLCRETSTILCRECCWSAIFCYPSPSLI